MRGFAKLEGNMGQLCKYLYSETLGVDGILERDDMVIVSITTSME